MASFSVKVPIGGDLIEFTFRKPTAREWLDYEASRLAYGTAAGMGNANAAVAREMMEKSEELCTRVVTSHTPEALQNLNDEHLGIFFPLAIQIAEVIDGLRSGAGKASSPPGNA